MFDDTLIVERCGGGGTSVMMVLTASMTTVLITKPTLSCAVLPYADCYYVVIQPVTANDFGRQTTHNWSSRHGQGCHRQCVLYSSRVV